jgi:hypothetical protein
MQKTSSVLGLSRRNSHWWSPIILFMYGLNLEGRIWYNIFMKLIAVPWHLLQSVLSQFLEIGTIIYFFYWSGYSSLFQTESMSLRIADSNVSLLVWIISARIWSPLGDLQLLQLYNSNFNLKAIETRQWWFICMHFYLPDITDPTFVQ